MDEPHGFFSIIFNQDIAHLLHDTVAVGLVDLVWNSMVVALGLYIFTRIRHRRELHSGKDKKHISFSLNFIDKDYNFVLRTIAGAGINVEKLFENVYIHASVEKAAKKTRPGQCVLLFPPSVRTEVFSIVIGHITRDSNDGYYRAAAGLDVHTETYVVMLTEEKYGMIRMQKKRGIITPLSQLLNLPPFEKLKFERKRHHDRYTTLEEIRDIYLSLTPDERLDFTYDVNSKP